MISVVKLGGSLLSAETLADCLQAAVRLPGRIVIVAGGGVFADLVREQQRSWHFDDVAAHRMAILAMQQTALLCQSLQPRLQLCASVEDLKVGGEPAIWLPDWRELDLAGIPASWRITSDSLAAWLAGQINADRLILVKAGTVDADRDLPSMQHQGLIDPAFVDFADPARYRITIVNQQQFLVQHDQVD